VDLNLIFKMQSGFKPTSPEESEESKDREVQQKLKQIEEKTQSAEAKEKLRQLGQMSDRDISKLVQKAAEYLRNKKRQNFKFKPLMKNLPNYTTFL
jgi:hypothetical protein